LGSRVGQLVYAGRVHPPAPDRGRGGGAHSRDQGAKNSVMKKLSLAAGLLAALACLPSAAWAGEGGAPPALAGETAGGRPAAPADLERQGDDGWLLVEGVPPVRQATREDCGAAALAMVLGYWGLPVGRADVSAAHPPAPEHGIKAAALRDFARRQGLEAF